MSLPTRVGEVGIQPLLQLRTHTNIIIVEHKTKISFFDVARTALDGAEFLLTETVGLDIKAISSHYDDH